MAYDRLDPIALSTRIDVGAAMVAHIIAETNRDDKKRKEPFKLSDFLVEWDKEVQEEEPVPAHAEPTVEDLLAKAEMWAALGAGVIEVDPT